MLTYFQLMPRLWALLTQGERTKSFLHENVQFCFRFDEKLSEKAQHTGVCEHFEDDFSSNMEQKWTFPILMRLPCLLTLWLAAAGVAVAGGPDTTALQPPPATVQNIFYCPPISALHKDPNTRLWSASEGWKSYELSFVDNITRFSGAQWRGTNVGQIFCIYRGDVETDFPVLLAYKILAFSPQGGKWSANLGGYENCETPNQEDCPFSIRLRPKSMDLYEEAEKLKATTPPPHGLGF